MADSETIPKQDDKSDCRSNGLGSVLADCGKAFLYLPVTVLNEPWLQCLIPSWSIQAHPYIVNAPSPRAAVDVLLQVHV
jgi:hypothetical protein